MLKSRLLAGVALATLCLPVAVLSPSLPLGATAAHAQNVSVSFQLFFEQLEPHGVWVRHSRYNYVFCPTGVDAIWRPYSQGRWLYVEDYGWYFASDEPFAWAAYHYGRWFPDQELGWCWVPGTKWAPAWVSWRRNDNVIGWAPLPPEGDGYAVSVQVSRRELPEGYWVYVPTERFVEPNLSVNIIIGSQQPEYYAQTQFLGPVQVQGDLVVNNVIELTYIEQTINQEVIVYQTQQTEDPSAQSVDIEAQALSIYSRDIAEPTEEAAPPEAIEEADASATIQAEGGTASAADLPEEPAAGTEEAPAEGEATPEETSTEEPVAEPTEDGTQPAAEGKEVAPAAEPEATTATEPAATEETDPADQPASTDEPPCPVETMVDGQCPPTSDEEQPVDSDAAASSDATTPADAETSTDAEASAQTAPAADVTTSEDAGTMEDPAPAPDAAPTDEPATAPASTDGTAPASETETTEEPAAETTQPADTTQPEEPLCPPEQMVDGKCPVQPAQ